MSAPLAAPVNLRVDDEMAAIAILGLLRAEPVLTEPSGQRLLQEIRNTCEEIEQRYSSITAGSISGVQAARSLYKAFGIDPTRHRPSSEALLRRVARGKPFPRINNAVDLCNLLAVRFLLPLGLYDQAKISGDVVFRRGEPGESYQGIRKDEVRLEGRPLLADDLGPFGNPTSDSLRTSVTAATTSLWMVIFAPAGYNRAALDAHMREACTMMGEHLAGEAEVITSSRTPARD